MKKTILLIALLCPLFLFGQKLSGYLGTTYFLTENKIIDNFGLNAALNVDMLYLDISKNFVTGIGKRIEYTSDSLFKKNATQNLTINGGPKIFIKEYDNMYMNSVLYFGFLMSNDIFQNSNQYYILEKTWKLNYGILFNIIHKNGLSFNVGVSRFEIKANVGYTILN